MSDAKLESWRRKEENSGRISKEQFNTRNVLISEMGDIRGKSVIEIFFFSCLLTSFKPQPVCGHPLLLSVWEPRFFTLHTTTTAGQPSSQPLSWEKEKVSC